MGKRGPAKSVVLGKKVLVPYAAEHWAVKVDDTWYEVPGVSKSETGPNKIQVSYGRVAKSGAVPFGGGLVGSTDKSQSEIDKFITNWEKQNPFYDFMTTNCQKFAKEFVDFLCDGCAQLPMMNAGIRGHGVGPRAWSTSANGTAVANASVGRSETQHGVARAAAEGPAVGAKALCGDEGFGAFAKASVGRAEAGIGNPVGVHVDLNINTGVGVHDGNFEASVLGFGTKIGQGGFEVNTPIGGAKCIVM